MLKNIGCKCLLGLTCLIISLTPKIVWSTEKICEAALQSNSNQSKALANFEKLIKKQSNLHKIDCDGKNLFEVVYSNTSYFDVITDVRDSRYDNLLLLLEHGYKVNHANSKKYTPLHLAALKGDINVIYLLVERGAKINAKNEENNTPLHLAARYGNKETVNLLLYLSADSDKKNKAKKTPLDVAIDEAFSLEKVEILLQHGAQPSDKTLENLQKAIRFGDNAQIVTLAEKYQRLRNRALLRGRDKDRLSFNPPPAPAPQLLPGKEDPPLYIAISQYDIDTVKKLLLKGEDANALSRVGSTSLNLAVSQGQEEITELLIEAGANVNLQDSTGNHPLMMARDNFNLTRLLLEKGALADLKTPGYQKTALIYFNNIQISKLLLEKGADINHESGYGDTPLSYAVEEHNLPLIKFLLEQGADASSTYNGGRKLFLDVAGYNKLEIVKLFLDYVTQDEINQAYDQAVLVSNLELENILKQSGANYLDKEKLFNDAVKSLKIEVVKRLLEEGMDVYLKTEKGSENLITSFLCCFPSQSNKSNYQLARLLLDNGADVNQVKKEIGYQNKIYTTTPLITAMEYWYGESSDLISILLEYGANVNYRNSLGETALYKAIAKPLMPNYGYLFTKDGYKPEFRRSLNDSLEIIKLLLEYGANIDIETENGSIEELVSSMKKSDRKFIVDFANEVDLLLDLYR